MITYRQAAGTQLSYHSFSAYCNGTVRIGLVEQNQYGDWRWSLALEVGNYSHGREHFEADAKEALERSFGYWCERAGLVHK